MRIIDLGGGTAYEYIGDSDREYQQLLDLVLSTDESGGLVERDLVPAFNRRSSLWACNPYTKERLKEKTITIRINASYATGVYEIQPNGDWKKEYRHYTKEIIQ